MSITAFFVFYAMVGYPLVLIIIGKTKKHKDIRKNIAYEPLVSYIIVAHNESKCIKQKLDNILSFEYPLNKLQIIVASDFCTDNTNDIVNEFIGLHPELNIILNKSKSHKGKTNAQNEAVALAVGEVLVFTDANSMFNSASIRELVCCFASDDVAYVCGRLVYSNDFNLTASSESFYWSLELKQREIESAFHTITAGNGSIYAVKKSYYLEINPILCHDEAFPRIFALQKKESLYNPNAIAYEKAGENNKDEFKRKVRMNRTILNIFVTMWRPLNCFRYRWFSFFYFGHRTCRYLLWLNHLLFFISSLLFVVFGNYIVGGILVFLQIVILIFGVVSIKHSFRFKGFRIIGYYSMTVLAQLVAAVKQMLGRSKPVWDKAESTR